MSENDDMVERVAKAIYVAEQTNRSETSWDEFVERSEREGYLYAKRYRWELSLKARAAIEAMREPTVPMLAACWTSYHPWGEHAPPPEDRPYIFDAMKAKVGADWQAMIDAALRST